MVLHRHSSPYKASLAIWQLSSFLHRHKGALSQRNSLCFKHGSSSPIALYILLEKVQTDTIFVFPSLLFHLACFFQNRFSQIVLWRHLLSKFPRILDNSICFISIQKKLRIVLYHTLQVWFKKLLALCKDGSKKICLHWPPLWKPVWFGSCQGQLLLNRAAPFKKQEQGSLFIWGKWRNYGMYTCSFPLLIFQNDASLLGQPNLVIIGRLHRFDHRFNRLALDWN